MVGTHGDLIQDNAIYKNDSPILSSLTSTSNGFLKDTNVPIDFFTSSTNPF